MLFRSLQHGVQFGSAARSAGVTRDRACVLRVADEQRAHPRLRAGRGAPHRPAGGLAHDRAAAAAEATEESTEEATETAE